MNDTDFRLDRGSQAGNVDADIGGYFQGIMTGSWIPGFSVTLAFRIFREALTFVGPQESFNTISKESGQNRTFLLSLCSITFAAPHESRKKFESGLNSIPFN